MSGQGVCVKGGVKRSKLIFFYFLWVHAILKKAEINA